jgi:hypothetical protein
LDFLCVFLNAVQLQYLSGQEPAHDIIRRKWLGLFIAACFGDAAAETVQSVSGSMGPVLFSNRRDLVMLDDSIHWFV